MKAKWDEQCCEAGCTQKDRLVGGHVWKFDAHRHRFDKRYCYIVPLCKSHNGREFDYPKPGFKLKRGTPVVRIVPHACYGDYDWDYVFLGLA
jgi:hypothetical protein